MIFRSAPPVAIILAAGQGTRMLSALPKVLHAVAGRPMIAHALAAVEASGAQPVIVIGHGAEALTKFVGPSADLYVQAEQLGTAHAVLAARDAIDIGAPLLVLCGDTPLLRAATLGRMLTALDAADIAVLGFRSANPTGYGRLLCDDRGLAAIREEKDADAAERAETLCSAGVFAFRAGVALPLLEAVGNANAQGEYYLPDVIAIARARGLSAACIETDETETLGVNDRAQLARAEGLMQARLRAVALAAGVTLVAPETVFLSADTAFATDVTVEPFCVFGPGVSVASGAIIHAFSHLEGARIGAGASVGPYARLRPGTVLEAGAKAGNFVETKAAHIGEGAKINHLSYVGDATVGAGANIGAGTITCNYDGFAKHRTAIGEGAFIGSNSALVAPVTIGAGAVVAAGSTITRNVTEGALAVGRARQEERTGWAARMRARRKTS